LASISVLGYYVSLAFSLLHYLLLVLTMAPAEGRNNLNKLFSTLLTVVFMILVLVHLFVKVPRPGESKMTFSVFKSSYHLLLTETSCYVSCPRTPTKLRAWISTLHIRLMLNVMQGNCEYQLFKSFGLARQGIEPSTQVYQLQGGCSSHYTNAHYIIKLKVLNNQPLML